MKDARLYSVSVILLRMVVTHPKMQCLAFRKATAFGLVVLVSKEALISIRFFEVDISAIANSDYRGGVLQLCASSIHLAVPHYHTLESYAAND